MRKLIIYLILFPLLALGQTSSLDLNSQKNTGFYLDIFDVIDKYEKNCRFSKLSRYNDFENLFTDSSSVYNDIIPSSSFIKNVSPRQYISEIRRLERKRLTVDIDVLEIGAVYAKSTNSGMIDVYVLKYMKARFDDESANIIYDDIKESIDWEHTIKLKIQLVYQDYRDTINGKPQFGRVLRINSINEYSKKNERFTIYVPFEKNIFFKEKPFSSNIIIINGRDYPLKGKTINYFLSKNLQKGDDIKLKKFESEYKFTKVKSLNRELMKKVMFRKKIPLQLSYNFNLNPSVDIGSVNENLTIGSVIYDEKLSASFSLYPIKFDKSFKTSVPGLQLLINTQVGLKVTYSMSEINFQNGTFTSVNLAAIDADNISYQRTHTINNIQETVSLNQTQIFLSFKKGWKKIKFIPEKLELGLIINPLVYSSAASTFTGTADANYSGYYEDLFGLVIGDDEQWDHYNLGSYSLDSPEAVEINSPFMSIWEVGGFLEYPFKIQNLSTGVNLGINYIINTKPLAEATENEISTNSQEYKSIISNTEYLKINDGVQISIGFFIKF